MASRAFTGHLLSLLRDAEHLAAVTDEIPVGAPERQHRVAALNRAVVVACVSAWEAYVEELVRESVNALRPAAPPLGLWPALNAVVRGQLGRFNNPNTENIRMLFSDALGLPDIQTAWSWQNCTSAQAVQRLADVMTVRHQIAHGVNPRPGVTTFYASQLAGYFRRLGHCTDRAVREHLASTLGVTNPWPP